MKTFALCLLFLLGVRPVAASQVFADNFTRTDTGTGGVGNGWQDSATLYKIGSNTLRVGAVNASHVPLLRDGSEGRSSFQMIVDIGQASPSLPNNSTQWCYLKFVDANNWIALKLARSASTYVVSLVVWKGGAQFASALTTYPGSATPHRIVANLWQNSSGVNINYQDFQYSTVSHAYVLIATSLIYTYSADTLFMGPLSYGLALEQTMQQFQSVAYYDTTPQTISVDDPVFLASLSPYNWHTNGANYVESVNQGAYFHLQYTGTSIALTMDVSQYNPGWLTSHYVKASIDGKPWTKFQFTAASPQIVLGTRALYGTHQVEFWVMSGWPVGGSGQDLWNSPNMFCRILSLQIDAGESLLPDARRPRTILFLSDSLGGVPAKGATFGVNDAQENWSWYFSNWANAEYGHVTIGAQGYLTNGVYHTPPVFTPGNDAASSWNKYFAGVSRLDNGLFNPQPDWIIVQEGGNDTSGSDAAMRASVQGLCYALRLAAPNAYIFILPVWAHWRDANLQGGVDDYRAANVDEKTFFVQISMETATGMIRGVNSKETSASADGVHPDAWIQGKLAFYPWIAIDRILNPILGGFKLDREIRVRRR